MIFRILEDQFAQKSKEAKMKAAMAGGKSKKKKWAKGNSSGGLQASFGIHSPWSFC